VLLTLHVELARASDADAIRTLLLEAELPVDDLAGRPLEHFLVVRDGAHLVGTVGLDFAGDAALLRSLAVAPRARTHGLGRELVVAAENLAWQRGAKALYLLTTTAEKFFARHGYRPARRAEAPAAIAAMPQFAGICPSSSAFMTKARAA
jgi:amino-acid N-acetyltransferase